MSVSSVAVVLLLLCGAQHAGAQQNNFYGTVMTYYPKDRYANGTMTVVLRYKTAFTSCTDSDTWQCYLPTAGVCGSETLLEVNTVQSTTEWCQREGIMTRLVQSNDYFFMVLVGSNWISNTNNIGSWFAATTVNLRTRSDTGKANRPPQTTIIPSLRVPSNCERNFNLLKFDPDGDQIICDVDDGANITSFLFVSTNCTVSFSATDSSNEGLYVVELTMNDYPNQNIYLTNTGDYQILYYNTTTRAISSVSLQFVVKVQGAVPSCTEGQYLPGFLPPTPANRAQLYTPVGHTLEITINAQATNSTVSELLFSGPHNMILTGSAQGQFILRWTPSQSEDGEHHPVCFVAQTNGAATYQSELRCVIVSISNAPATTTSSATTTTPHPIIETTTPPTITTTTSSATTTTPPPTTETTTPPTITTTTSSATTTTPRPIIETTTPPTITTTTSSATTTTPTPTTETITPPNMPTTTSSATTTTPPTTTETTTPPNMPTTTSSATTNTPPPPTTETTTPPITTTTSSATTSTPPTTTETTTPPNMPTTTSSATTNTPPPPETTTPPITTTTSSATTSTPPTTTETTTPPNMPTTTSSATTTILTPPPTETTTSSSTKPTTPPPTTTTTSSSAKPTTAVTPSSEATVTIILPTSEVSISYTPGSRSTSSLKMRISSKTPLTKENIRTIVLPKLKEELVKLGLPEDIILKLINVQQKE